MQYEEIFSKYDKGNKGALSLREVWAMTQGMSNLMDPVGWVAAKLEWLTLWLLCRDPDTGLLSKDDVRRQVGWGIEVGGWCNVRGQLCNACTCCMLQGSQWRSSGWAGWGTPYGQRLPTARHMQRAHPPTPTTYTNSAPAV